MKVLSMEAHLSRYLALNRGRIRMAAKRKTKKKSSRVTARRERLGDRFNSVACRIDLCGTLVTALQAIELALAQQAGAMQAVAQKQPEDGEAVTGAGEERR